MKTKLGDIASYVNGYAFKPSDWSNEGAPIIRIQDLTGNSYQMNRFNGNIDSKYEVLEGDILISWSASLGIYVWKGEKSFLNQHIFKVILDEKHVLKPFYIHQVEYILEKAGSQAHGATMKHLTRPVFNALPFYLPNLEEQKKIADELDCISDLIDKHEQQINALDELVKSRFIELFGDIKELGIRWGEKAFKEVTYNLDSKRKPVKDADRKKMQGKYPYYGATGIVDHVNEYRQEGVFLLISEDGKALEFRNKPIAFIAEGKIWVNNHAHVQQCKPECNMIYLMYYINLIDISAWVTGIDQKKLNRENLDSIPVALPPVDIQEQFAAFVAEVDKSKHFSELEVAA